MTDTASKGNLWNGIHSFTARKILEELNKNTYRYILKIMYVWPLGWWDRALTNHSNGGAPPALGYGYG